MGSSYPVITTNAASVNAGTWEQQSNGDWHLVIEGGTPATNRWAQIAAKWYVFDSNGKMITSWAKVDGSWYCFNGDGSMMSGWANISGKWYYFGSNGAMLTGWVLDAGKWYYLGTDGAMLVSTTTPDGYQVGSDGSWIQ